MLRVNRVKRVTWIALCSAYNEHHAVDMGDLLEINNY